VKGVRLKSEFDTLRVKFTFTFFGMQNRMILRIVSAFMSVVLVSLNPTSQISLTTQAA